MATIGNVKLPDLINRWIEVQKPGTGPNRSEPLNIDVINLTLMLKSMGLRLKYLDFDAEKDNTDSMVISIKCNRSGIRAEMSYDLQQPGCSCPEKTDRDSSFWEVQATGPTVFSKFKNNTSSNLLPDVSERCAVVSRAMLSNLLEFYQASIRQVKEGKERPMLNSPLKNSEPSVCVTSPGLTIKAPFSTPPAEGKCTSRVSLSQRQSTTPMEGIASGKEETRKQDTKTEPSPGCSNECKSNTSSDSVGINNKTHDIVNSEHHAQKPVVEPIHTSNASVPDENVFACNEAMKTVITSSPVARKPTLQDTLDIQHDRDANVINYLHQARSQIDMALMLMKLNTTQDISNGSGHTMTPRHTTAISRKPILTPKFQQSRSSSLLSIERRRVLASVDMGVKKKLASTSSLGSTPRVLSGTIAARADTPRPSIAHIKSVAALRRTATMPSTSAGSGQQTLQRSKLTTGTGTAAGGGTLSGQRKFVQPSTPLTVPAKPQPRPPISIRPASSAGTKAGIIQRSSSASYISKK
ncbi:uncharacterized protein LOC131216370 [Anopheles bellator]|uniref:uncharacterized protein LOC131216370 n=1 Tax=Anopheles bellator TaxID=139047 RepID=UPI0026470D73|nr:uncharacterized protein LOC131216370 [Anopheles bellator]